MKFRNKFGYFTENVGENLYPYKNVLRDVNREMWYNSMRSLQNRFDLVIQSNESQTEL